MLHNVRNNSDGNMSCCFMLFYFNDSDKSKINLYQRYILSIHRNKRQMCNTNLKLTSSKWRNCPTNTKIQRFFTTVFVDTRLWKTKHSRKRFPKFPSIIRVISKSTNHSPLAWRREGQNVTLVAVIGEFRSDMSITRMIDGNSGNVSASVLFSKVAYQRRRW